MGGTFPENALRQRERGAKKSRGTFPGLASTEPRRGQMLYCKASTDRPQKEAIAELSLAAV